MAVKSFFSLGQLSDRSFLHTSLNAHHLCVSRFLVQKAFVALMANACLMILAEILLLFALSTTIFLNKTVRLRKENSKILYLFALLAIFTLVGFFGFRAAITVAVTVAIAVKTSLALLVDLGTTEAVTKNSFTVVFGQALARVFVNTGRIHNSFLGVTTAHVAVVDLNGGITLSTIDSNANLEIKM